ncbi:hypothetical protein ABB34_09330 [Stenotrophomonas daejeonensis]|uniref:HTH lysR-type domain-containing protein n=1 Tax=Stenotrophomonas daejeonensis TaxID=659018 RepID=A0A0R0DR96_9GAMM|nr:LysR family transcriptional regulator [Stenotrophomonas daejeonensis]KRG84379.1 hypothetical protein ABB34_09330 [Stenotrophomonas daejeonensis]
MTTHTPHWDDARALLAVLRAGSLLAAARTLGVTQPTVRRRIESLEAALGMPLFTRGNATLVPTETALGLRRHLEAMERAAAAFQRGASADATSPGGRVRVTTSEMLGVEFLPSLLASLHERLETIEVELSLTDRIEDLVEHGADIALRTMRPEQAPVIARRVGVIRVGLFAAPELIEHRGTPPDLEALTAWPLVTPDRSAKDWAKLHLHGFPADATGVLRTDNHLAQLAAVRAGIGIGPCHCTIARRDGLVSVLEEAFGFELELWLAMPESLRSVHRITAAYRHLGDALETALGSFQR